MTDSPRKRKLDDLLTGAIDLHAQPDFAAWCRTHPQAVEALRSLPIVLAERRSTMVRVARYSTAAAALFLLAAGAWWMLFSHGASSAWAAAMDRLAQVRSATCDLYVRRSPFDYVQKVYLEGPRVRTEEPMGQRFSVTDFREGKTLSVDRSSKTAWIRDLKNDVFEQFVLGSNPLEDLVQMKNVPAERLPDERVGDVLCQVYRVKGVTFVGFKVPWVKLWLDPGSKLPVEVHAVIGDRQAMTLTAFRWNLLQDKALLELAVPKGYKLLEPRAAAPAAAGSVKEGAREAGRESPRPDLPRSSTCSGSGWKPTGRRCTPGAGHST